MARGHAAVIALLPTLGDGNVSLPEQVFAYALAIAPSGLLLSGLLVLATLLSMCRTFSQVAASALLGAAAAYLGGWPESPVDGPTVAPLARLLPAG